MWDELGLGERGCWQLERLQLRWLHLLIIFQHILFVWLKAAFNIMLSLCERGAAEPEWKYRITLINKESQSLWLQGLDSFIQLLNYWCTSVFLSTERKVITDIKLLGRQKNWQSNIYPCDQQRPVNKAVFVIAQAGSVVIYNMLNNPPQKRQCSVDGLRQGVGQSSNSKSLLSDIFCNRFRPPNTLMPSYTTPHTKALHNQSENTFTLCSSADNTPRTEKHWISLGRSPRWQWICLQKPRLGHNIAKKSLQMLCAGSKRILAIRGLSYQIYSDLLLSICFHNVHAD